jgi:hypothetical protein
VDLDEKPVAVDFGAQRAAAFQLAVDLALQASTSANGSRPAHRLLNGSASISFMRCSARITSAACCGML